jgi:hypothetical protein
MSVEFFFQVLQKKFPKKEIEKLLINHKPYENEKLNCIQDKPFPTLLHIVAFRYQ